MGLVGLDRSTVDFCPRGTAPVLLGSGTYGECTKREMLPVTPQESSGLWVGGLC